MFIGYEQVDVTAAVKTAANLTIPAKATHVRAQAETSDMRYTMDNSTTPSQTLGMILTTTAVGIDDVTETFLIEDLRRIKFTRGSGSDGKLNLHYFAGRDV